MILVIIGNPAGWVASDWSGKPAGEFPIKSIIHPGIIDACFGTNSKFYRWKYNILIRNGKIAEDPCRAQHYRDSDSPPRWVTLPLSVSFPFWTGYKPGGKDRRLVNPCVSTCVTWNRHIVEDGYKTAAQGINEVLAVIGFSKNWYSRFAHFIRQFDKFAWDPLSSMKYIYNSTLYSHRRIWVPGMMLAPFSI